MADVIEAAKRMNCGACPLGKGRLAVRGYGNPDADVMLIGEAPGATEDRIGKPFVGRAGRILTSEYLPRLGTSRDAVWLDNVVLCRPARNRRPTPREIEACRHWLAESIRGVDPKVIIALGRTAATWVSPETRRYRMSRLVGKGGLRRQVEGKDRFVIYLWHPAKLLYEPGILHAMVTHGHFERAKATIEGARCGIREVQTTFEEF